MQPIVGVSQDPSQGGLERADPTQPSPKEAGSPFASELGSPRLAPPTFDLFNMVISFKRMAIFLEPLNDTLEIIHFLLGWKMPLCSLITCLVLNVLLLTLSEVAWFSLCLLGVSTPAVLGYLLDRCGGVSSEAELQRRRYHAVQRRDLQTVHLSRQDAMLEVKDLLKQLDKVLTQACESAESMYKVLYWESRSMATMFYGGVMVVMCLLYTSPLGWVLAMLNSALFLWNRHFFQVLLDLRETFHSGQTQLPSGEGKNSQPDHSSFPDQTPTPTSVEDFSPGSVEEAQEADDEFKDAIEDDDDAPPEFDSISDNGILSRNEPIRSKVSKLTEKLRKRYPTNNSGSCSSCAAAFTVLKKRRNCSNCGNSFCSRCCSYKVLKSCMGATAPEAQRETVFVCATCNTFLSK